jgi:hypothetical protein
MAQLDLTFITNEKAQNLKARFEVLIKGSRFFDCLVGYFYTSGFHALYRSLEHTENNSVVCSKNKNMSSTYIITLTIQNYVKNY